MPPKKTTTQNFSTKPQPKEPNSSGQGHSRKRKAASSTGDRISSSKAQKKTKHHAKQEIKRSKSTVGSNHNPAQAPAPQASPSRLPDPGQTVTWKAMPGWVEGTVVEILKHEKEVKGKNVTANEADPRVVLKSNAKSGKICVHKPQAIFFH